MLLNRLSHAAGGGVGPNLILDPGFDDATKWTASPSASVSGGQGHFAGAAIGRSLTPNPALVSTIGLTYRCTYTILNIAGGSARVVIAGVNGIARNANGTYVEDIVAVAVSGPAIRTASSGTTLDVDDFSVQVVS